MSVEIKFLRDGKEIKAEDAKPVEEVVKDESES